MVQYSTHPAAVVTAVDGVGLVVAVVVGVVVVGTMEVGVVLGGAAVMF